METLKLLKSVKSLEQLAPMLGFTPAGLSYILYVVKNEAKYSTFDVPKKMGGSRIIQAPIPQLKLLQSRLAKVLARCVEEIRHEKPGHWRASHGFQKKKTIVSNAKAHKRRRFVFNIDLSDFFGTINFGRVRGFFINDKYFELPPEIATILAQIACHDNALPQGSPVSPIISNLIGNIIDVRLLALARDCRCTYTRYADDLTFSTNEVLFPSDIAINSSGPDWEVGKRLSSEIKRLGFSINGSKTRMSLRRSRQSVTGLVVNAKVNVEIEYYRAARAMCNSLFRTGKYFRPGETLEKATDNLAPLEGTLSHIHFVKNRRDRSARVNKLAKEASEFRPPQAPVALYRKFLVYKNFVAPTAPVIVTEGISDITYLRCAIRSLGKQYPLLAESTGEKLTPTVSFLRATATIREVLNLGNGAAGQASLVAQYSKMIEGYSSRPLGFPVIVLCDNDDGPKTVFKNAKSKTSVDISTTTTDAFYYLGENLYLVKVPEGTPPQNVEIESLFTSNLLETQLDGKAFDMKKEHGNETAYGKVVFAEKVVKPNWKTIDFSGFGSLLERLEGCVKHYQEIVLPATAAAKAAA